MSRLREIPTLYGVAAVMTLLSLRADDVRGLSIAGACILVGVGQQVRDDRASRREE